MPNVKTNGIQIEYDTFGDPSSTPLLLIAGIGLQMIIWDQEFCNRFVENGYFVIRFDNRDAGLSTKFEEAGIPDMQKEMESAMQGKKINAPYTFDDMADDALGLLTALNIDKAHICGMSMGAHIAQTIAIRQPSRVLSLISIYGQTGNPELSKPKPEIRQLLFTPPPKDREGIIDQTINTLKILSGPGFPFNEERRRQQVEEAFDRCFYPIGRIRQFVAGMASGNRKPALMSLSIPTLVVHGSDDPLILVEGGRDTAEAISGSELLIIEGMGHDLPSDGAWPQIINAMLSHLEKVNTD